MNILDALRSTVEAIKSWTANEMSDKIVSPQKAKQGQLLSVKTVDKSGRPETWECVDDNAAQVQIITWEADD
jgi:hypothetical protein